MTNESAASDSQAVPSSLEGAKILDVSKITQDTSNPCVLEVDDIADTLNAPVSIDRPTPGQSSEVSLKPGTNYLFDFAESDVSSLVESCGNLVMSFQDGATLTLANFSETISADIPSMLAFTGELIGAEGEVDEAGDGEIVNISNTIETPSEQADFEEPQTEIRATQPKQESVQQVIEESVQHTSVSITGQMQSQRLVISDEATAEELMALSLANIEPAAGEASSTPNLAQSLANIEPAAGEAAGSEGNTGFGFGSSFDPRGVIPLNDVGPINPTALQYGITLPDIDLLIQDEEQSAGNTNDTPVIVNPASPLLDESNLGPNTLTGLLDIDFGNDQPGDIFANNNFSVSGSVLNGALTSGGNDIDVTESATGYVGTINNGSEIVFEFILDQDTGGYEFNQYLPFDHADGNNPDDEITLSFGVEATDIDGDAATTEVIVKIADDAPVANDDNNSASESETVTGNILGNDDGGVDTPVNIVEFDGQSIPVNGLTVNGNYGVLTIQQDGSYSYTANSNNPEGVDSFSYTIIDFDGDRSTAQLTIDVTAIDDNPIVDPITESIDESDLPGGDIIINGNLNPDYGTDGPGTVTPVDFASSGSRLNNALTSNGVPVDVQLVGTTYTGTANGEIIFTMDVQPDGSYTFTLIGALDHADGNNPDDIINLEFTVNATDQDNDVSQTVITIEVADDAPVANDDSNVVEQNQNDVSGNVTDNDIFGVDETHIVTAISFNGNEVPVDITNGATINGDHGVLTINIDGSYTYISNGTNVSVVEDVFTYSLMDFDGDIDKAELVITINDIDDKPTVDVRPLSVDETDIDPTDIDSDTATGSFGNDGPGAFAVTGVNTFTVVSGAANNALTSGGVPVEVNVVNGQYVGTANQETIFTFDIDAQTGEYTFTLIGTLDHADTNDPNDNIVLTFGVDAVDQDGDIASALVTVNVFDDAPVAVYDCVEFNGYIGRLESNVIENDNLGSDRPASVTQVSFGANSVDVPANGTTTIDGDFGSLEIAADGSYTYRLFDVPNINTIGSFATFIATPSDLDGFQSSITLDGITVTSVNGGDLVYGDRGKDGTGVGIQDGTGSDNVFGNDEALDVSFDPASEVTLAISEIGDNNSDGTFGVDYEITFEDGSTLISEQQFVPGEIVGGTISFTLSSDDFGGKLITNVTLSSTNAGSFKRASFLLNSVEVEYPVDTPDNTKDKFVYTLTDYDGDTDEAILKIKADYDDTTIQTANDNGVLFGTDDADIFVFDQIDQDIDTVKDFDLTDGDVIDVTQIIGQANATQDAIDDFVFARNVSGDTELSIDINGSGDASNAIPLAIIEDVNDLDLGQALKTTSGIV